MIHKTINYFLIKLFIFLIKFYQYFLSPLLKVNCRYLPTCSEYAKESLTRFGIIKGSFLSIKRITTCHPFGGDGYDPVPQKIKKEI